MGIPCQTPVLFMAIRYNLPVLAPSTIHRAWQLFQGKRRKEVEDELERQYTAMRNACEALRVTGDDGMVDGVNTGRLYRIAMNKTGVWQGIPIEYARLQTEWPSKAGWNHDWKRI